MNGDSRKNMLVEKIVSVMEQDIKDGCFDKALYNNDIVSLKDDLESLTLLKRKVERMVSTIPKEIASIDQVILEVDYLENEIDDLIDKAVSKSINFNEGMPSLLDVINGGGCFLSAKGTSRKINNSANKKNDYDAGSAGSAEKIKKIKEGELEIKSDEILRNMLNLIDQQWITETDFNQLPEKLGVNELQAKIFLMTKIVGLIRLLPEEMFSNEDTKQNMISSSQESLDCLIEEEAEEEIEGLSDVELGFGIVGEITADLGFVSADTDSDQLITSGLNRYISDANPD